MCFDFPILHPRRGPLLFSAWGPGPGWARSALHLALMARLNSIRDFKCAVPSVQHELLLYCTHRPPPLLVPWTLHSPQCHRTGFGPRTGGGSVLPCPVCPAAASHISGTRSPFVRGRLLCLLLRGPRPPPPECLATGLTILAPGTDLGTTCALSSPGRARGEAWTPRGSKSSLVVCLWLSQALGMTQTSPSCVPTAALTVLWDRVSHATRGRKQLRFPESPGARMGAGVESTAVCWTS